MRRGLKSLAVLATVVAGGALLSGCLEDQRIDQTRLRMQDDFGRAVTQDLAAQIANPDAGRDAGPPPPSNGARANLAVTRYRQDAVTPPSTIGASGTSSGTDAGAAPPPAPTAPTTAPTAAP